MTSTPLFFPVGSKVILQNLVKGAQYNGEHGKVTGPLSQSSQRQKKTHECAICLEEITDSNRCMLVCCGQGTCKTCAAENETRDQSIKIKCCPLCRHPQFGGSGKERYNNVLKFAERGEAWAQTMMGDIYMNLDEHIVQKKVNKVKARKWYSLAEKQEFAEAIYKSADLDEDGMNRTLYYEKLEKAALLGEKWSAQTLAIKCLPKMRYWANEAGGEKTFLKRVSGPDDYGRGGRHETHCAYCNIEAPRGTKFKQCVRCKAAWYCSKDCQVEAWKAGHKSDCKQRF